MKKAMVYILALTVAFSAMLTGCGEMGGTGSDTPAPTETPQISATPDPSDGIVRDEDGLITEEDSGVNADKEQTEPKSSTKSAMDKGKLTTGSTGQNQTKAKR